MKFIYTLITLLFVSVNMKAQDTLLFQNFEDDINNMIDFPDLDSIGTNNWLNWDSDDLEDANARPQNWTFSTDFYLQSLDSIPPTDSNLVFSS